MQSRRNLRLNPKFVDYLTKIGKKFNFEISTLAKNMLHLRFEILKRAALDSRGVQRRIQRYGKKCGEDQIKSRFNEKTI